MTSKVPLAGVIGQPVGHSKSPCLHGWWLARYGLRGHYVPLEIAEADLAEVLRALPRAGFVGTNVTIPHKQAVMALTDDVSDRARRIGAANFLTFREDGGFSADSTDGYGFIQNLRQSLPDWDAAAGPAAIFGAGGAARAVIDALLEAGVPELRLSNRSRGKADELADLFGPRVVVVDWAEAAAMVDGAATLVNTTSLGMTGQPPFTLRLDALTPGAVASDLVYVPLETPFLVEAARHGARTVDGLGMLLHQAVPAFARWFGRTPEVTDDLRQAMLAP